MIGDEVTVVHVDKSYGTMSTPERFKDYVVTGIKHRQPENWEGPDVDTSYYVIGLHLYHILMYLHNQVYQYYY